MVLSTLVFSRHHGPELTGEIDVARRKAHYDAALNREDSCVIHRFGREAVMLIYFEPEHVPRHMKGDDLTATVAKHLIAAYQSADHLVQIFGWLSLTENLHIAGVG